MVIGFWILAVVIIIGVVYMWIQTKQIYNDKDCDEVTNAIIALEVNFDKQKAKESLLLKEMSVYIEAVSLSVYKRYIDLLTIDNLSMGENVTLRKRLLSEVDPLPERLLDSNLAYRHHRSKHRLLHDTKRCELISSYIKRLQSEDRNYFPALKALIIDLKSTNRD